MPPAVTGVDRPGQQVTAGDRHDDVLIAVVDHESQRSLVPSCRRTTSTPSGSPVSTVLMPQEPSTSASSSRSD
jgi:hypothetical protein